MQQLHRLVPLFLINSRKGHNNFKQYQLLTQLLIIRYAIIK